MRGDSDATARAQCLLHAHAAGLSGDGALAFPPPSAEALDGTEAACRPAGLSPTVVEVPAALRKDLSEKIQKLLDEHGTFAAFIGTPGDLHAMLEVGQKVEAKFGDSFFDAEVVEASASSVKVRYVYDGSEADVARSEVRAKAGAPTVSAGQAVQAKYGNSMFDAEVVDVVRDGDQVFMVKVKYKYDGSEAELPQEEVKTSSEEKPEQMKSLYIYGQDRPRVVCALQICKLLSFRKFGGDPKYVYGRPDDPTNVAGISKQILTATGKILGTQGATRNKLQKVTGAAVEVIGEKTDEKQFALIAGTPEERRIGANMISLVQSDDKNHIEGIPPELESFSSRLYLPEAAVKRVMGGKRQRMNEMEDNIHVLVYSLSKGTTSSEGPIERPPLPRKGLVVEGKYGDQWHAATIVEVPDELDKPLKVRWQCNDTEGELLRAETRDANPSSEVVAARECAEKSASLHCLGVFGAGDKLPDAVVRIMGLVETDEPGTYVPTGDKPALIEVPGDKQVQVSQEVEKLKKEAEDAKWSQKWEEARWNDQKWDYRNGNQKRDDHKEDQKWNEQNKWDDREGNQRWNEQNGDKRTNDKNWDARKRSQKWDDHKGDKKWTDQSWEDRMETKTWDNQKGDQTWSEQKWDERKGIQKWDDQKGNKKWNDQKWDDRKGNQKWDNQKGEQTWNEQKCDDRGGDQKWDDQKWDQKWNDKKWDDREGSQKWDDQKGDQKWNDKNGTTERETSSGTTTRGTRSGTTGRETRSGTTRRGTNSGTTRSGTLERKTRSERISLRGATVAVLGAGPTRAGHGSSRHGATAAVVGMPPAAMETDLGLWHTRTTGAVATPPGAAEAATPGKTGAARGRARAAKAAARAPQTAPASSIRRPWLPWPRRCRRPRFRRRRRATPGRG
ncbi:unnamed protein product [Prorocentrum cordatum]|uniref:Tudor domain-containing protein n=1 Tax=Prorocentrum cordatum TaxID=2364126 RepID=A0ABN9XTG9_9DINO|nr:unnamed protein product [Polarella glacialis]